MQLVDFLIAGNDGLGQRIVAIDERPHRFGDRLLDHAAHAQHAGLQLRKFLIEKGPSGSHDQSLTRIGP